MNARLPRAHTTATNRPRCASGARKNTTSLHRKICITLYQSHCFEASKKIGRKWVMHYRIKVLYVVLVVYVCR